VEYKVQLQGEDGKEYLITYGGLREKLDVPNPWNPVTEMLRKDLDNLCELVVNKLLLGEAKNNIINFLREHPKVETRILNRQGYMLDGLEYRAWYKAKQQLEQDGVIVSAKQGRGRNRLWMLKEA